MGIEIGMVLNRFIEDVARQENEERRAKYGTGRDHFYFSESGGGIRKIVYDFFGTIPKESSDGRGARIFHNGEYVQLRYEQYFRKMGVFVAREIHLKTYEKQEDGTIITIPGVQPASGRADIIVDAKRIQAIYEHYFMGAPAESIPEPLLEMEAVEIEPGETYYRPKRYLTADEVMAIEDAEPGRLGIVEMKSIGSYGFDQNTKSASPKYEHQGQCGWYQYLTGITHGWVLYENKNDQAIADFYQERDENMIVGHANAPESGYNAHFAAAKQWVEAGQVPPRCEGSGDGKKFPCQWKSGRCNYFEHCWNPEHNGEFIPGLTDAADSAEEDLTLDDLKALFTQAKTSTFWIKLIDAEKRENVVHMGIPEPLRSQMLEFLYPNAVEVEWEGMDDEFAETEEGQAAPVESQPAPAQAQTQPTPNQAGGRPRPGVPAGAPTTPARPTPAAPVTPPPAEFFAEYTGSHCSLCEQPQYTSPSGVTCENGHGGAESLEDKADRLATEAAKAVAAGPKFPRTTPPKPAEPVGPPKVIKVTYEDLTQAAIVVDDFTHDEYVALCDRENNNLVAIQDAEELLPGYFDALSSGKNLTALWNNADYQNAALTTKPASAGVKQAEGEALEQVTGDGVKYIYCAFSNCTHTDPIEFKRLGNGGVIKCPGCKQNNKVIRQG